MKPMLGGAVSVQFFMPSAELTPYFSTYYLTETRIGADEEVEDWLHPEWANLRFADQSCLQVGIGDAPLVPAPNPILSGPTSYCGHFKAGPARIWGVGILPLGWVRFVDAPAADYADIFCDASTDPAFTALADLPAGIFGAEPDPAAEARRIDAYLMAALKRRRANEDESRIHAAHAQLHNHEVASVAELAERLAISPRSLERLSNRAFGFSPKLLLRRQRFLRSLAQFMLDPSLTWIRTLDWHYVDQAHFVRDFKRFMAMSPSSYAGLDHPVLRAAAQARSAAAGAAVQALHQP